MAPALSEPNRKPSYADGGSSRRGKGSFRRAAEDIIPHMEDHNMGLQNVDNFMKDSQEMDQILGELGGGGEVDILQVIKTMEGAGGGLAMDGSLMPSCEADAMFPLATFERDFLSDVQDVMNMCSDDNSAGTAAKEAAARERIKDLQAKLDKRCQFMRRRLRIQQARGMGKHVGEEVAGLFEQAYRACKRGVQPESTSADVKVEKPKGLSRSSVKSFVKRLESASVSPKKVSAPPTLEGEGVASGSMKIPGGLTFAAGALRSQLAVVERQLDSDATISSSGAESADETVPYNNPTQETMPLSKRALWRWSQERASIASRWTWLQGQIQVLEYKIRALTDLQRQMRASKRSPSFLLQPEPSGYSGTLPGNQTSKEEGDADAVCARVRPYKRHAGFKVLPMKQMYNLHTATEKVARPSDVRCICQWPVAGCAVCTGRAMPMHPLPPNSTLSKKERIALVDPAFHPVLSTIKDVSPSVHYLSMMKDPNWQQKCSRGSIKSWKGLAVKQTMPAKILPIPKLQPKKKKHRRLKRGRPSASSSIAADMVRAARRRSSLLEDGTGMGDDLQMPTPSGGSSPVPSPSDHHRYRVRERMRLNSAYDIDNIVIPHSMASNSKVEILQYKEILTPKWRIVESKEPTPNNGLVKKYPVQLEDNSKDKESDIEDVCDATVMMRHDRCEAHERGKYLKKRKNSRRQHSRSTAISTPSHTPPHTPAAMMDETSMTSESGTHPQTPIFPLSPQSVPLPPTSAQQSPTAILPNLAPSTSLSSPLSPRSPVSMAVDSITVVSNAATTSAVNSIVNVASAGASSSVGGVEEGSTATVGQAPPLLSAVPASKRRATDEIFEIVAPFSPRMFPLNDEVYNRMLTEMPEDHPLSLADTDARRHPSPAHSPAHSPARSPANSHSHSGTHVSDSESNSGHAFLPPPVRLVDANNSSYEDDSCSIPPEEDPNDPEWNAAAGSEKLHHR